MHSPAQGLYQLPCCIDSVTGVILVPLKPCCATASAQYAWLKNDLANNFDRERTPWLIASASDTHWLDITTGAVLPLPAACPQTDV